MNTKTFRSLWVCFLLSSSMIASVFAVPEMAMPNLTTYPQLLYAIRKTRIASQQRLDKAVNQEKVREAWETGKLIDMHVLQHKERAEYGQQVVIRLAQDLETSETELRYMLQFARTYPNHPPADELSWAHYRELLSINDETDRKEVLEQAVQQHWNRDQVRAEVRKRMAPDAPAKADQKLESQPGVVGTYRIVKAASGPYKGELAFDLGFSNYYRFQEMNNFSEGDLVQVSVAKTRSGTKTTFKFIKHDEGRVKRPVAAADESLFTYEAYVIRVTDGDTFHAVIDLGFGFTTEQKLRLRGLDAPEIESAAGREAKAFLETEFAKTGGVVLIKTVKSDKYDRYLADVWLGQTYLNNLLLEQALAVRMKD
ncbi:MAG TPA: DUF1016 N-terminal domain-containing protein [bacterium]|nr:DUF1016 N-terminal domain-containing protein [bacterium]